MNYESRLVKLKEQLKRDRRQKELLQWVDYPTNSGGKQFRNTMFGGG